MLFPEEDAPLLKAWIVKRIEDTSDADSEVLAEYIIALLKHEGTKEEVRTLCEAEIPDFLTEDSAKFLDDVFRAIAYKSYVPGAAPPPSRAVQNGAFGGRAAPVSKKRGFADFDAPMENYNNSQNSRPMKNVRWNGPELVAQNEMAQGDHQPQSYNPMPPFGQDFEGSSYNMPQGSWGPREMMEHYARMQEQMTNLNQFQQLRDGGRGGHKKKMKRCRDFDSKGFCARGPSCNFDHVYNGPMGSLGYMPSVGDVGEDYNPDDPNITLADPQAQFNPWSLQPQAPPSRGRGNKRGRGQRRRGAARAPFSMEGPETDMSKSTIVIENIPEESFTEEEVRTFFSTFGPITDITMQPYKRLAIVKYEAWDSANEAYHSPKVIFDNRFVKVFWYRDESQVAPPHKTNNNHNNGNTSSNNHNDEQSEPFDPEEFARKQEEAQKAYQEKEAKRAELDRQRTELELKQQDLLERHKAESTKLHSKLLSRNGSSIDTDTNPLRAQLALLEQEAKMLGIDPNASSPIDDDMSASSWSTARGSWRGARGARGRGRGGRGRVRIRGEDRYAAYSRYSLDLRPRRVGISGVDFTDKRKEESLRCFLLNLGEFDSVEPTPEQTIVTLRDRKTTEKLYTLLNGNMVPGVEGVLTLEYLPNIPGGVPPTEEENQRGEGGGVGSGLGGGGGLGVGEGLGSGRGTGMVIDTNDSGSEEGEVEDDDGGRFGGKMVEDDDAY